MKYILMIFIIALLTLSVHAQWQQTNCNEGVKCMLVNGPNIFAGTFSSGIFLSQDNGNTWVAKNSGILTPDIYSLVSSGSNIFAGSYIGVYLSQNNGNSWTVAGTPIGTVNTMAVSGINLFAGNNSGNILLSQNNGNNWTVKSNGIAAYSIISLAASSNNTFAGTDYGVYRTQDNGNSWVSLRNGIPNIDVYSLWVDGNNIFAGTYMGGIYMSGDNGDSWSTKNNGLPNNSVVYSFTSIDSLILAGTGNGLYISSDWGNSWTAKNEGFTNAPNILALSFNESWIFAGTPTGVWKYPLSALGITDKISTSKFQIYPNPATDRFFISPVSENPARIDINIYDVYGNPMKISTNRIDDKIEFNIENYPKGFYFINIQCGKITENRELIVN